MKTAVIFGVTGQDGSYLSELLLEKKYSVHGVKRRSSTPNTERIKHLIGKENFHLIDGDVTDSSCVARILDSINPEEIYNLSAQSFVKTSFNEPEYTLRVNCGGVLNILEWMRKHNGDVWWDTGEYRPRLYQASTSEMFGSSYDKCEKEQKFQNEKTIFSPCSPYAVSKLAAHNLCKIYRESYGLHVSCGILFNHESERRGEEFVTRKITRWLGELKKWMEDNHVRDIEDLIVNEADIVSTFTSSSFNKLRLGNLDAYRDFGHAEDYVRAMQLMLQHDVADDYVISTGITHSIKEFLTTAFMVANIPLENHSKFYIIDETLKRPLEVDYLCGNADKAKEKLGWSPKVGFRQLVQRMVLSDSLR